MRTKYDLCYFVNNFCIFNDILKKKHYTLHIIHFKNINAVLEKKLYI